MWLSTIRYFNSFWFQVWTCPQMKSCLPHPLSPQLHNPYPTSNLSASKFCVELGARVSFNFGKKSTSSKKSQKKKKKRRKGAREGLKKGQLNKKGSWKQPHNINSVQRAQCFFDALSVIKFKTMLEIWWTCSWGYQRNTDGSWFGEVMGSPVISWWFQRWDEHLEMTMAPTLIFHSGLCGYRPYDILVESRRPVDL